MTASRKYAMVGKVLLMMMVNYRQDDKHLAFVPIAVTTTTAAAAAPSPPPQPSPPLFKNTGSRS